MSQADQPGLFDARLSLPEGFRYQADLITPAEEADLVAHVRTLPFKDFEFHGFSGKRRVVSFGWRYDFDDRSLQKADDIPPFLMPLRQRAAAFAGLAPEALQHVLVTEYGAGAAIGWHRDKAVFDEIVGVSLFSPCRFRLRRRRDGAWERAPRSCLSRARRTSCPAPRARSGSTASRRSSNCATPSPSATSANRSERHVSAWQDRIRTNSVDPHPNKLLTYCGGWRENRRARDEEVRSARGVVPAAAARGRGAGGG
jgi:alkylated DNA repair dioxygenase AlkB